MVDPVALRLTVVIVNTSAEPVGIILPAPDIEEDTGNEFDQAFDQASRSSQPLTPMGTTYRAWALAHLVLAPGERIARSLSATWPSRGEMAAARVALRFSWTRFAVPKPDERWPAHSCFEATVEVDHERCEFGDLQPIACDARPTVDFDLGESEAETPPRRDR